MQLEDLLTEADVGESYDVDPVLQEDCGNVVESVCSHVRPGEGRCGKACSHWSCKTCMLSGVQSWQAEGTKILSGNRLKDKIRCQVGVLCQLPLSCHFCYRIIIIIIIMMINVSYKWWCHFSSTTIKQWSQAVHVLRWPQRHAVDNDNIVFDLCEY